MVSFPPVSPPRPYTAPSLHSPTLWIFNRVQLTTWNTVLLEKLTGLHVGSTFHRHETRTKEVWSVMIRRSYYYFNPLKPNDDYSGRTAPLTSKRCILYIYSTNTGTEYFKHGIHSPFFPLQNAVCFINLTYLVLNSHFI